jgi:glutamate dehydrogenase (NAD(P)+)
MLLSPYGTPVPVIAGDAGRLPSAALFDQPADMVVLAAGENAMTTAQAGRVSCPLIVVGANRGLAPATERLLHERGVLVIPDFVGGVGGSASMEALFGPVRSPGPAEVLDGLTAMMRQIVAHLADTARRQGSSMREAAGSLAAAALVAPTEPPYGCSPYLTPAVSGRAGRRPARGRH